MKNARPSGSKTPAPVSVAELYIATGNGASAIHAPCPLFKDGIKRSDEFKKLGLLLGSIVRMLSSGSFTHVASFWFAAEDGPAENVFETASKMTVPPEPRRETGAINTLPFDRMTLPASLKPGEPQFVQSKPAGTGIVVHAFSFGS